MKYNRVQDIHRQDKFSFLNHILLICRLFSYCMWFLRKEDKDSVTKHCSSGEEALQENEYHKGLCRPGPRPDSSFYCRKIVTDFWAWASSSVRKQKSLMGLAWKRCWWCGHKAAMMCGTEHTAASGSTATLADIGRKLAFPKALLSLWSCSKNEAQWLREVPEVLLEN